VDFGTLSNGATLILGLLLRIETGAWETGCVLRGDGQAVADKATGVKLPTDCTFVPRILLIGIPVPTVKSTYLRSMFFIINHLPDVRDFW
jgi:hypothetical protein